MRSASSSNPAASIASTRAAMRRSSSAGATSSSSLRNGIPRERSDACEPGAASGDAARRARPARSRARASTRYGSFGAIAAARCRRERAQPIREHLGRVDARLARQALAQRGVVRRRERDVAGQRAQVEPGAAGDDRAPSARVHVVDRRERVGDEARRASSVRAGRESRPGGAGRARGRRRTAPRCRSACRGRSGASRRRRSRRRSARRARARARSCRTPSVR